MKNILIIGATSAMATAFARISLAEPTTFFLVARDADKLRQTADDLRTRGASAVHEHLLDINEFASHKTMLDAAFSSLGKVDVVLIAHGTLPDQKKCESDVSVAMHEFSTNALSSIAVLTGLANRMQQQNHGVIAIISSVAGDRGRPSNYLYGAAKAAVTTFCEGLRARMFKHGVHVLLIKPGFVDTPMTKGLPLPGLLVASAERVAKDIACAVEKKKDSIYTPWFWSAIMMVIRNIPTFIFKRTNL